MPHTKAAVFLFHLMACWKGLQILINIPINKERWLSSPQPPTQRAPLLMALGWEVKRLASGWGRRHKCLGGCLISCNIQVQMDTSIKWALIVRVNFQMLRHIPVQPPTPVSSLKFAYWGNLIEVGSRDSNIQSMVVSSQENKMTSWSFD